MERPKFFPTIERIIDHIRRTYNQTKIIEVSDTSTQVKPRSPDQIQREDYNDRWRTPELHGGDQTFISSVVVTNNRDYITL